MSRAPSARIIHTVTSVGITPNSPGTKAFPISVIGYPRTIWTDMINSTKTERTDYLLDLDIDLVRKKRPKSKMAAPPKRTRQMVTSDVMGPKTPGWTKLPKPVKIYPRSIATDKMSNTNVTGLCFSKYTVVAIPAAANTIVINTAPGL